MIREQLSGGPTSPGVGTVVVTYNSSSEIVDCIRSVLSTAGHALSILVVDNNSTDRSVETLLEWFVGDKTFEALPISLAEKDAAERMGCRVVAKARSNAHEIALLRTDANRGFAGGVNVGLTWLERDKAIEYYWILNPDCVADSRCVTNLLTCASKSEKFGIAGGRVYYAGADRVIQSDGGVVNMWTGLCKPHNHKKAESDAEDPSDMRIDYISGAHMLVSRAFVDAVGHMPEQYFLYYEEVDWCLRRGEFTIHYCPDAPVYHSAGHSAGSGNSEQRQSPLSAYFMARSRVIFVAGFRPWAVPVAIAYAVLKAVRGLLRGETRASAAALRGTFGLGPDGVTMERLRGSTFPLRSGRK
ncbi:glycosyltransferase family 2 protein [Frigidibacter sp. RF13]|uniref:glycosyltransferase family 2 protein n=1 Tax=Frigidibacter sp. RF13 TaxID=2997340 RepID=UPI0022709689|nr:glycosyltransferase family 2 protein [Frigidibacter sp. RF13]MCY1126029.1 glycosyltransferase family 2 protein [Frigidibacter sp. RF13]